MKGIKNIEKVLDDILSFLKKDLNNCITKVNAEYTDGIVLDSVDDASYYIDRAEFPEDENFVNIVLDDSITLDPNNQGRAATELNLIVSIWFTITDAGNNNPDYRRGLRYAEALLRTLGNRTLNSVNFGYEMTTLLPVRSNFDKGAQMIGTGIQLSYKFA